MNPPVETIEPKRRSNRWGLLFTILMVGAAGLALVYMVYRDWEILLSYDWQIHPWPLAATVLLHAITMLFGSWNWGVVMDHFSQKLPYVRHFRYFCLSHAAKRLPGTLWYIAGRATLYRQEGIDARLTSLASGIEYALTTLSGILVGIVFSLSILDAYNISRWLLILPLAAIIALFHPRVLGIIFRFLKVELNRFGPGDLLRWTAGFTFQWLLSGLLFFTFINIIYPLPLDRLGYVIGVWVSVIMVTRLLLFAPSNLGITEIGFSLLLAAVIPAPIAVAAAVFFRLFTTLLDIVYAGAWLVLARNH